MLLFGWFLVSFVLGSAAGIWIAATVLRRGIRREAEREFLDGRFSSDEENAARQLAIETRGPSRPLNGNNEAIGVENWNINNAQIQGAADVGCAAIAFFIARGAQESPELVGARFGQWWHGLPPYEAVNPTMHEYFRAAQRAPSLAQRGTAIRQGDEERGQ